jgi:hypothetical protein
MGEVIRDLREKIIEFNKNEKVKQEEYLRTLIFTTEEKRKKRKVEYLY